LLRLLAGALGLVVVVAPAVATTGGGRERESHDESKELQAPALSSHVEDLPSDGQVDAARTGGATGGGTGRRPVETGRPRERATAVVTATLPARCSRPMACCRTTGERVELSRNAWCKTESVTARVPLGLLPWTLTSARRRIFTQP